MGGDDILISHLQFGDDIVVLIQDNVELVRWLRSILGCFEAFSGLAVNLRKSMVFPIENGVWRLWRSALSVVLGPFL